MCQKAHLEILRAVTPSLRFHRLGKLEDIQSSTFLSTQTGFGDCCFFHSPGHKTIMLKRLPRASRGSSFRFRLIRRIV